MLTECLEKCPREHWDAPIARYTFWQVAYHTLCFLDVYLSPSDTAWRPRQDPAAPGGGLHPLGRAELENEYPSREFDRAELLAYASICREKIPTALDAETDASLAGTSGFPRLRFSRAELHLYNLRHVQHHTGQLTAALRRTGIETSWARAGRADRG